MPTKRKPRPTKRPPLPAFIINGQVIPGPFWGKLVRAAGDDPYRAVLALFRARNAAQIIPYLQAGIKGKWIWRCTREEENPENVKTWVATELLVKRGSTPKVEPERKPGNFDSISDILSSIGFPS
jgi:hypothetical protein